MTSTPAVPTVPAAREASAGAKATYAVFAGLGIAGSTWASRLPQVRTRLDLDTASLGLLLLTVAVGGVIVLPLSGTVVARFGPRRAITVVALAVSASLGAISLGYALSAPLLVAGLFVLGAATGFWDVAMPLVRTGGPGPDRTGRCPADRRRRRCPLRARAVHRSGVRGNTALGNGRGARLRST